MSDVCHRAVSTAPASEMTRRAIVRTGAKLAYAAPLVAASFRMTGLDTAAAVSGGNGQACGTCGQPVICGQEFRGGGVSDCQSLQKTNGECACIFSFAYGTTCSTDADCQSFFAGGIGSLYTIVCLDGAAISADGICPLANDELRNSRANVCATLCRS